MPPIDSESASIRLWVLAFEAKARLGASIGIPHVRWGVPLTHQNHRKVAHLWHLPDIDYIAGHMGKEMDYPSLCVRTTVRLAAGYNRTITASFHLVTILKGEVACHDCIAGLWHLQRRL